MFIIGCTVNSPNFLPPTCFKRLFAKLKSHQTFSLLCLPSKKVCHHLWFHQLKKKKQVKNKQIDKGYKWDSTLYGTMWKINIRLAYGIQYRPSATSHLCMSMHFLALEWLLIKGVWYPICLPVFTQICSRVNTRNWNGCHATLISDYFSMSKCLPRSNEYDVMLGQYHMSKINNRQNPTSVHRMHPHEQAI